MWGYIIVLAISIAVSYAMQVDTTSSGSSDDVSASTCEEGGEIPVLFGTRVIESSNIVWYGDLSVKSVESSSSKW